MLELIATYPGFFLIGLTTLGMMVKGLRASVQYDSWKPFRSILQAKRHPMSLERERDEAYRIARISRCVQAS